MIYKESPFKSLREYLYHHDLRRRLIAIIHTTENIKACNIRKLLPFAWLISIITLAVLTQYIRNESSHFFGIADNSEQTISFSYPVEIVQNLVIEGAEVKQGQPILEVRRSDLSAKLTFIKDQIDAATALHNQTVENTRSRLEELTAMRSADLAKLDVQIKTLRARQKMNGKLLKEISGKDPVNPNMSPLFTEMRGLMTQRNHLQDSFDARITNLKSKLETENDHFKVQIAESQDRKIELERQLSELIVKAKFDGRIGSVNFKSGDQIAPFETILTLHSGTPLFVKGYIHENVYNHISIGQLVWVQRYNASNDDEIIQGKVESLGSRIIEYPMRLKKNQLVSAWGREAIVRLPHTSSLLLGEKVIVAMDSPDHGAGLIESLRLALFGVISDAEAAPGETENRQNNRLLPIVSKVPGLSDSSIEASGVMVGQNPQELLIVNDEIDGQGPHLLIMNHSGEVTSLRKIAGDVEIDDMESISRDDQAIYVSASLSHNKKGEFKQKRCQLIKLKPEKDLFKVHAQLNLCKTLTQLARNSENRSVSQFLIRAFAHKTIDVESHVVNRGKLYLGFKTPLDDRGNTIIIQIDDLEGLFSGKLPQGRIWQHLSLSNPQTGAPALLSDMRLEHNRLWLLGISQDRGRPSSHLWSYDTKQSRLRLIKSFPGQKAEGVSERMPDGRRVLVFDGNRKKHSWLIAFYTDEH